MSTLHRSVPCLDIRAQVPYLLALPSRHSSQSHAVLTSRSPARDPRTPRSKHSVFADHSGICFNRSHPPPFFYYKLSIQTNTSITSRHTKPTFTSKPKCLVNVVELLLAALHPRLPNPLLQLPRDTLLPPLIRLSNNMLLANSRRLLSKVARAPDYSDRWHLLLRKYSQLSVHPRMPHSIRKNIR
jgi:hypothetical protein